MERVDVNYKNNKRYKTAKYPIRQPKFFVWLIWVLSKFAVIGKKYKIEKINVEDEKIRNTNFALAKSVRTVLNEGLRLLGIQFLEEM